jgi:ATP-dependent Lon protease
MKHIHDELGEEDARTADINELRKRIEEAGLPEDVRNIADKELKRLERINQASPEYTVSRTYLDYLSGMPWNVFTTDSLDMLRAEEILNEDHYNLKKVKERILEFLAVRSLRDSMKGRFSVLAVLREYARPAWANPSPAHGAKLCVSLWRHA